MDKLGFGMMRLPLLNREDEASIDLEQVKGMVDTFLDNGFTYFDTAYMYHNYKSEAAVKTCLVQRHPRNSFTLATKLPTMQLTKPEDCERIFNEQLENCGVDFFDYYLLHNLGTKHYKMAQDNQAFEFVNRMKQEGKIKTLGFSFHDKAALLDTILTDHPEMEFVQLQINYLDWESPTVESRKCLEVCEKHHKPVIIMEPVKGGALAKMPAEAEVLLKKKHPNCSAASWALRFAATRPNVFMVLSGMSDAAQLEDNIKTMRSAEPLTEEENQILIQVSDIIAGTNVIACTNCKYCVEGCPKHIPIPEYFAVYNAQKSTKSIRNAHLTYYNNIKREGGAPSDCVKCKKCIGACPQHLRIPDLLKKVQDMFEGEL